jgi:hypothetical protein
VQLREMEHGVAQFFAKWTESSGAHVHTNRSLPTMKFRENIWNSGRQHWISEIRAALPL